MEVTEAGEAGMEGIFITFEGPDGSGKTTALQTVARRLAESTDRPVLTTREPGGSPIAEKIRELILDPEHTEMDARTEALLYAASRRQHLVEKVIPVLERGGIILCDRFVDSSIVYQGFARGIGAEEIRSINHFAIGKLMPDLTLLLDVSAEVGLARIHASETGREYNRLDQEAVGFHQQVRQGYLQLAEEEPERIVRVDASRTPETVAADCLKAITARFPRHFS